MMNNREFTRDRGEKDRQDREYRDGSRDGNYKKNQGQSARGRACPFTASGIKEIDYKDVETLKLFTTERGKILPRRITGVSSCHQRKLTKAIKQARYMALMPFVAKD